jgi:hypothetical protein
MQDAQWNINRLYSKFQSMYKNGAVGAAFVSLAEIFHILLQKPIPSELKLDWEGCINRSADKLPIEKVCSELFHKYTQLGRILAVGGAYNEDEFLQILTLRIEIELAEALLIHLNWPHSCFSHHNLDEAIHGALFDPQNARSRNTAVRLIRRNWGIPLKSEWLKTQ